MNPLDIQCNTALPPRHSVQYSSTSGHSVQYSPTPWTIQCNTILPPGQKRVEEPPRTNWSSVGGSRTSNGIAHCSTIHAGDPLRSYTSEKAVMFNNSY